MDVNYGCWKRKEIFAAQDRQGAEANEDGPDSCCENVTKYDLVMPAFYNL